uniref:Chromo domain-containing protein n=1 Tax=Anopheles minimus TaxID=112268 RepID=A0A182VUT6_9DIPT
MQFIWTTTTKRAFQIDILKKKPFVNPNVTTGSDASNSGRKRSQFLHYSRSTKSNKSKSISDDDGKQTEGDQVEELNGFEKGFVPEKILGATEGDNELLFLIQWKDKDRAQLVKSKEARKHCPQLVIDFYEERLIWQTVDQSQGE